VGHGTGAAIEEIGEGFHLKERVGHGGEPSAAGLIGGDILAAVRVKFLRDPSLSIVLPGGELVFRILEGLEAAALAPLEDGPSAQRVL
jgi:hypothetical protein